MKKKLKQIKCRNCGKMVSAGAKRCKYCGTVLKMPITGIIIVVALVLLIVAIIIIGVLQSG